MKNIFTEILNGVFIFLTIGILINNLMETYVTTINSFPLIFFICFSFTIIALFTYDILIVSENITLLNRNTEIIKKDSTLTNKDKQLTYIVDILIFILHTSYLITLLNTSLQLKSIYFFLIQYILFFALLILLYEKLHRNIKLRRLLRNNETISKHHQPAP